MRIWHILQARVQSVLGRGRRETDLSEELGLHLEQETARWRDRGLPSGEARQRALRDFGGVEQVREACRDARGTALLDSLVRDLRHSGRRLLRDWRFSLPAMLILGLGIGANTAIFSAVNAALLRPQPFANPEQLVDIYQRGNNAGGVDGNSYPAYLDMAEYTDVFAGTMAAAVPNTVHYRDGGAVQLALAECVTASYPTVLGFRPAAGRWFEASEDVRGAALAVVLGHRAWLRKFNADPAIVGRRILIEGAPATIVGIAPQGYDGTLKFGLVTDFYLPISAIPALGGPPRALERRPEEAGILVKARLRSGVTVAQAQAAMSALATRLAAQYPTEDPGKGIYVVASQDVRIHPQLDRVLEGFAAVLLAVVGLVLAIACSNVATLLLVRGAARAQEIATRLAIGATRPQVVRHLLAESMLIAVAGGLLGGLLAWWITRALAALDLPILVDLRIDARVLIFAVLLSLITGIAFGLAPALYVTRTDRIPTHRDGEVRSSRDRLTLKNALVVFQVAVSILLLGVTGVVLRLVSASSPERAGYAVDGVAMLETDARYGGAPVGDAVRTFEELRRRVAALPGVESAALARGLPMQANGTPLVNDDSSRPPQSMMAAWVWAGPGFFDVLRIPLLHGRGFDDRDRAGTPRVAVINESMARRVFGTNNPVGRRFRPERDPDGWIEVIGVVRDTGTADLQSDLSDPEPYLYYRAFAQSGQVPTTIIARTSFEAGSLVAAMERELRAVDPLLPVLSAKTMAQYLGESLMVSQAIAAFLGSLGAIGLGLASIGLYAVVAFAVARRTREIGIRMALGASGRQVIWAVARQVATLAGVGTAIGLTLSVLAIVGLRAVAAPAPGVSLYRPSVDPLALLAIAGIMVLVSVMAGYFPARRASRINPLTALRRD